MYKDPKEYKNKGIIEFTENSLGYVSQDYPYNLCLLSFVRYFLLFLQVTRVMQAVVVTDFNQLIFTLNQIR